VLSITQYQNFSNKDDYDGLTSSWIRFFIIFIQILSIIFVALRFYSELEIIKFRHNRVDENVGLTTVGLFVPMLVEMLFHIVVNPPMNS
jgi:hypothetical protein